MGSQMLFAQSNSLASKLLALIPTEIKSKVLFTLLIICQITLSHLALGSPTTTVISSMAGATVLLLENSTDYPTGGPSVKVNTERSLPRADYLDVKETFTTKEPNFLSDGNNGKVFTTIINEETSTIDGLNNNYDIIENQIDSHDSPDLTHDLLKYASDEEIGTDAEMNDIISRKISRTLKKRRQANNYRDPVDWWVNLATKTSNKDIKSSQSGGFDKKRLDRAHPYKPQKKQTDSTTVKGSHKGGQFKPKRTVYKEQPLNQNAIVTTKYQLSAIKRQHKTLVTRSIRQLQQLDNKLIDSYKLCLKKKNPLYAGMLYRTRDFVIKMAKEVKVEKAVLESMSKQVQKVLNQKMNNRTLVREYNRLMATPTESTLNSITFRTNSFDEVQTKTALQQQQTIQVGTSKVITRTKKDSLTNMQEAELQVNTTGRSEHSINDEQEREESAALKKTKQTRYTVSVNEVNLRKKLNKVQALIDRINGSCYELTLVVEDINYLFRIAPDAGTKKLGSFIANHKSAIKSDKLHRNELSFDSIYMMLSDQKRTKMLKSPSRVLFEKYGKLPHQRDTLTVNNSTKRGEVEITTIVPEMKPLFDSSSFSYKDYNDLNLKVD